LQLADDLYKTELLGQVQKSRYGGSERRLRYTIGQHPTLTLAVARAETRKLLAEFMLGKTSPQVISYKKAVEQFIEEKEKARRKSMANAY
jgi:hypothetical protein